MKKENMIFTKIAKRGAWALACVCMAVFMAGHVYAAASNGCDGDNEYINPTIALCSAHAYNIGLDHNPETPYEKQAMNDIVALKSTIITQQMKKQYDYLDATIRRFRTQLEKAILTAKMEAAGASTGTSSSGAQKAALGDDCSGKSRTDTVYCLRQNYAKMSAMVSGRNFTNELKDQIVKDTRAIRYMDSSLMQTANTENIDCAKKESLVAKTIPNCLGYISGAIIKLEESGRQQTNAGYGMGRQY